MIELSVLNQLALYLDKIPYSIQIIQSLAIIIAAYLINRLIVKRWFLRLGEKAKIKKHYLKPLKNLASFLVYLVAVFLILGVFGLRGSLTSLLAGAGFAGIVIGFAAKDIIGNLIGGLVLILDKPFRVGDVIKIKDVFGKIEDISIRTTTIRTFDGEIVTVPNAMAMNEIVINRTLDNTFYRINFSIGVDYDSDIDRVLKICREVIDSIEEINKEPKPEVVFDEFASSSINFILRFWIDMDEIGPPAIKTKMSSKLKKKLEEEGIGIPFPHLELLQHGKWKME